MGKHPFLDSSFEIRWSELTPDRVEPDIRLALQRAQERIDALAAMDPASATYETAIVALEESTEELAQAWGKVNHLDSVCNSPDLRKAMNAMLPEVSSFFARIPLNEPLWEVVRAASKRPETQHLEPVFKRFVEETVKDFQLAGADLPKEKKERLEQLQSELSQLTQKFSENTLDATNAFELVLDEESRLRGLPERAKEQARQDALRKGYGTETDPRWRFTLHAPSLLPALKYADDDALRRELYEAFSKVGREEPYNNLPLVKRILELRNEKAHLLGKENFPDLVLERRMAKNGRNALRFVEDMHRRVKAAFDREVQELEEFKAEQTGGARAPLAPWEVAYWSEKLRKARYDFDDEELRPYFSISKVIEGMFRLTERLFGLRISERKGEAQPQAWHPDVRFYDIHDAEDGRHLGSFYADWHPRESKRSGAWMNYLITGAHKPGQPREPHLGLICGNMTEPLGDKPALLSHSEVETVFHEFGHLLHHLLGEVPVKSMNGVNVAWDFVELPSQIMENWCWERESLDLFARHHETGEVIPEDLFNKMLAARKFGAARATVRQLSFGKMDLELHLNYERYRGRDLDQLVDELLEEYKIPTVPASPNNLCSFGHLFSDPVGYAAGYYSYKWAEVLDADAFTRFRQEGILNEAVGRAFRTSILSRGNSADPSELFHDFMGRDPDPEALLVRDGLA